MSVIDRVKSHFETLQTIQLLKFLNGKMKMVIHQYFILNPLTLEEKNIIFKKSNNFQDLNVLVDLIVMKLKVKDDKGRW